MFSAQESGERVGARVIEGLFSPWVGDLAKQAVHSRFRHPLRFKRVTFLENGIFGRFQDAVKAAQDDHRKHHQTVLRRPVRPPKPVRDLPDPGFEFFVGLLVHAWS